MIRLHRLEADNFRQLRDVELAFPDHCRILVEGENESGKSTLFEAVYFALYGKPIAESDSSVLVHNRATTGLVRLVFSVDGAQVEVQRILSRGAQRVTARGRLIVTRSDGRVETIQANERVAAELNVLLHGLDAEAMRHSCYVEQKGLDRTADLTVEGRKKILLKLLDQGELISISKEFERAKPSDATVFRATQVVELAETYRMLGEARQAQAEAAHALLRSELAKVTDYWEERLRVAGQLEGEQVDHVRKADSLIAEIETAERFAKAASALRQLAEVRRSLADHNNRLDAISAELALVAHLAAEELPRLRGRRDLVRIAESKLAERDEAERGRRQAETRRAALAGIQRQEADLQQLRTELADLAVRQAEAHEAAIQASSRQEAAVRRAAALRQAQERVEVLESLDAEAEAIKLRAAELQRLARQANEAASRAAQARTALETAQSLHISHQELLARIQTLRDLRDESQTIEAFQSQIAARRQEIEAAEGLAGDKQAELQQAQAVHAAHQRAEALRGWVAAQRQIVVEQKTLRDELATADQAIVQARTGQRAAQVEVQQALMARWWAMGLFIPGLIALMAAVGSMIAAMIKISLLIDARLLAVFLAVAGLTLIGLGVVVWLRATSRAGNARKRLQAFDQLIHAKATEQATSQGMLIAYEQKAAGLLATPRTKLIALQVQEPSDVDVAEALAGEIQMSAGNSLPDLDELTAAISEIEARVSGLQIYVTQDEGALKEQIRQFNQRLGGIGLNGPGDIGTALAMADKEATDLVESGLPDLHALEQERAGLDETGEQLTERHRTEQGALNERTRALTESLVRAGVATADGLAEALTAARKELKNTQVGDLPDVAVSKAQVDEAVMAEQKIAADHSGLVGELNARQAQVNQLLADLGLSNYAEVVGAVQTANEMILEQTTVRDAAGHALSEYLVQLGCLDETDPAPWLADAKTATGASILEAERQIGRKALLEGERNRVESERDRQSQRADKLLEVLAGYCLQDPSLSAPTPGEEEIQAAQLDQRYQLADVSQLQVDERKARNSAAQAAERARQARVEGTQACERANALLAELGKDRITLTAPLDVHTVVTDLPPAPSETEYRELVSVRDNLGVKVGTYANQCSTLQLRLSIDPVTLNEEAERGRLAQLEHQARVSRVAAKIIDRARTNVINQLVPATLDNACLFLPELTSGRYHDAVLDERSFQLKVWDAAFGRMVEREVYSGGAQDQFALALRLGFALAALPLELGAAPAFIFLDEPVASFDRSRREAFVNLIRSGLIGERFDQILVSEPEGIFPDNPFPQYIRMQDGRIVTRDLT